MAQLLVRDLDPEVVNRLKARAERHGRSLGSEARVILTDAAGVSAEEARRIARQWQQRLAGRAIPDTTDLVREDRDR